jgi:hypothetical protein
LESAAQIRARQRSDELVAPHIRASGPGTRYHSKYCINERGRVWGIQDEQANNNEHSNDDWRDEISPVIVNK